MSFHSARQRRPWLARNKRSFVVLVMLCLLDCSFSIAATDERPKGHVTVEDAIRMTKLGNLDYSYEDGAFSSGEVAEFSPDGKKFVVILRKGNLEANTNDFSMLLWNTDKLSHSPAPEVLLTMSSSSNRPAIEHLTWLDDNETVVFLGEHPGELHQVYTLEISTRTIQRITNHPTNLLTYSVAARTNEIAFVAEPPPESLLDETTRREGVVVSTETLVDLLSGKRENSRDVRLFVQTERNGSHALTVIRRFNYQAASPSLSPDGKYILLLANAAAFPSTWEEYSDQLIRRFTTSRPAPGRYSWLSRYTLLDTTTGVSRVLLDAPVKLWDANIVWSRDSHSVTVAGAYLPLDGTKGDERKTRQDKTFVVEVKIPSMEFSKVTEEEQIESKNMKLLGRDPITDRLVFETRNSGHKSLHGQKVFFEKNGGVWRRVTAADPSLTHLEISMEQDMNTPPRIFAIDPSKHEQILLLDLNPQFRDLKFARVEEVHWKGLDGHTVKGGLYYPPDYLPGRKYPLVIQTHAWSSEMFWIDGPWTTAFAAQPLAAKGILVLQAEESLRDMGTPQETPREASTLEGAINYLDVRGLIDPKKVGIIGFSRTGQFVMYALTHSGYEIAAASIADGSDLGYLLYIAAYPDEQEMQEMERMLGALPYGNGLKLWIERSPGFNLDKVRTPVRILATNRLIPIYEWNMFVSLARLDKAVEMIYLPDGTHVLEKPWERIVSQLGNLDWFCFWLKGEEDPDPAKADQYRRWRELRKLQEQNARQPQQANPPPVH